MRPSTPSALRAIHSCGASKAGRSVSNPYLARTKRSFITTFKNAKQQDDPTQGTEAACETPATLPGSVKDSKEVEEHINAPEGGTDTPSKPVGKSNYGSAMNRAYRNVKKPNIPTLKVPQWFLDSNVILREVISGRVKSQNSHPDKSENSPVKQESPTATSAADQRSEEEISTANLNSEKSEVPLTEGPSSSVATSGEQNAEEEDLGANVHSGNSGISSTEKSSVPVILQSEEIIDLFQKLRESRLRTTQVLERQRQIDSIYKEMLREIATVQIGRAQPKETQDKMERHRIGAKIMRPYQMDARIMQEIIALVAAGLKVSLGQYTNDWTSSKTDLVLFCPNNGGSFFLDELVIFLAALNGTDLVRLDPQDIAEIGGSYLEERRDSHTRSLSSLGYDAYLPSSEQAAIRESQETEDSEEDNEQDDNDSDSGRNRSGSRESHTSIISIPYRGQLGDLIQSALANANSALHGKGRTQTADAARDLKMERFVETILDTSDLKRASKDWESSREAVAKVNETSADAHSGNDRKDSLIVMVRDYPEINATYAGGKVLEKLHEVVRRRRKDGQRILIIGTSSSLELVSNPSKSGFQKIESEPPDGPTRTIIIPFHNRPLGNDHHRRMGLINLRNLQDMLRRLARFPLRIDLMSESTLDPGSLVPVPSQDRLMEYRQILFLLGQHIWPLDSVHFTATVTLGLLQDQKQLTANHVLRALHTRSSSDDAKFEWLEREMKISKILSSNSSQPTHKPREVAEKRMSELRKKCNNYEKRLLSGVVDADSIRTTFANIQVPPKTVEALKTLTSLSLVRPDAFTYGVLATEKISGLLLYGPPGTGKTLLAKAVAKESGATVLEVSGSDVYNKYVGEGEKIIKAIFSLAKKLTPCIVFIDEADAILGSRGHSSSRTSHRELINQFLREWDGMNDHSAFIMVATNRPYDLDEACLRRLPRRLLIDLPTEQDREAILRIHVKDEALDPAVSLPTIASQTPFYSGSDLKNVVVAAALSCVREEIQQAATTPTPSSVLKETDQAADAAASSSNTVSSLQRHMHPEFARSEKRNLLPRHFAHALDEISASVSEDMGSLKAIRKFDEKYGDRRGRKKKLQSYGFNTVQEEEKSRSDAARVRDQ